MIFLSHSPQRGCGKHCFEVVFVDKLKKVVSYILVAVIASAATWGAVAVMNATSPENKPSKLEELEALIQEKFIGEADPQMMEDAAAAAMVASLGDRWSGYLTAEEYSAHREDSQNAYVGIGITVVAEEGLDGFRVQKVEPNGPAQMAGILPGDVIIGADNQNFTGVDIETAKNIIRGKADTTVSVTVLRDGAQLQFTMLRKTIETVVATGEMLEGDVGLVTIANFNGRCAQESIAATEELLRQGAKSIIFDVRFNPGGYVTELVELLDFLLPEGELFRSVEYTGEEAVEVSDPSYLDIPMAVLVNDESYSAAEFFAVALQEYDAAVVVGEQTCGKGYYQMLYKLSDNSAVNISIGKYYTPHGVSIAEAGGCKPDVVVEMEEPLKSHVYSGTASHEEDTQLQAALQALQAES